MSGQKLIQARIEPGEYLLRYIGYQRTSFRGIPKLSIEFEFAEGEHQGRLVKTHFNVEETEDGWSAPENGRLAREFTALFADVADLQEVTFDALPMQLFHGRVVVGLIEMTAHDADKHTIHKLAQTPVVRKLIRLDKVEQGDESLSSPCSTSPCSTPPCSTSPSPSSPSLPENGEIKVAENPINADVQKCIKAGAKTSEDVEKMTGGRISADDAAWYME